MPDYRVYIIGSGGHLTSPPDIVTVDTDQEAIDIARQRGSLVEGAEVWCGDRLVCCIPPKQTTEADEV
jgi:hypothetical protein